jgi:hypothetical protein
MTEITPALELLATHTKNDDTAKENMKPLLLNIKDTDGEAD